MSRSVVITLVIFATSLTSACEAEQCTRMRSCCAAISDQEWVGEACGAIVADLRKPRVCTSVLDAIEAAAEDRKATLPAVCK